VIVEGVLERECDGGRWSVRHGGEGNEFGLWIVYPSIYMDS